MPFGDFYKNRRVLITGHTGFKGAWLSLWLKAMRAEVTGYALAPDTAPNLFTLAEVARDVESVLGDVRDFQGVCTALKDAEPEIVFHLAAQPLVRRSYREPKETFEVNVQGTVNLLEAVRQTPSVRAAAIVTSDKCYRDQEWLWGYRETDPLGGHDPYSASKAAAEMVVRSYRKAFFESGDAPRVGVASLRAGNAIGGGDFAEDRLLPDTVRAVMSKTPIVPRAIDAVRPWQHVLEPLSGYLTLAMRLFEAPTQYDGAWNFGPSPAESMTVGALVERFLKKLGKGECRPAEKAEDDNTPHETTALRLSAEKAFEKLGWRALYTVDEAVDAAAEWYRVVVLNSGDARRMCLKNIGEYTEKASDLKACWAA
jgi:CDP-glucose 4,6-dehydratase